IISGVVFAVELFGSTLILARSLHAERAVALTAAWLVSLVAFPFLAPWAVIVRLWGNPHFCTLIAGSSLAISAFIGIRCRSSIRDALAGVLAVAVIAYMLLTQPSPGVMALPAIGLFAAAAFFASQTAA